MKVFIIHDDAGQIKGTIISTQEGENAGVRVKNGLQVHTMEIDKISENRRQKYLLDLHRNYYVNLTSEKASVEKKRRRKPRK